MAVLATMATQVVVAVVPVGTAKAHCPSRAVVTPLRLAPAVHMRVMHPSLVLSRRLVAAMATMPSPAPTIPAPPVALVVVVPAAAQAVLERPGRETLALVVLGAMMVVVVVGPAPEEAVRTVVTARRPQLVVGLLHAPAAVVAVATRPAIEAPVVLAAVVPAATTSAPLEAQTPAAVVAAGQAVAVAASAAAPVVLVLLLSVIPRAPW